MAEIYRFRPTSHLLASRELEDQYIYFSKPDELNDPTESLRDVFWRGDAIIWNNLFLHFLYCIQLFFSRIQVTLDDRRLEHDDIFVNRLSGLPLTTKGTCPESDRFCDTVFKRAGIDALVESIGDREVRYDELLLYLKAVHSACVPALHEIYTPQPTATEPNNDNPIPWHKMGNAIRHTSQHAKNTMLRYANSLTEDLTLGVRLEREEPCNAYELNYSDLLYHFPGLYLERIETLLYPNWYVACFSKSFRNSSSWAHYADSHRGACLIFSPKSIEGTDSIDIRQITGYSSTKDTTSGHWKDSEHWSPLSMQFHDIEYGSKPGDLDFFRSMGALTRNELRSIWHTDELGNLSVCCAGMREEAWRNDYWDRRVKDITRKTKDWKHEQETRLVMLSDFDDFSDKRQRKCGYDFEALKGIILGIKTPDHEKQELIRILKDKSRKHGRDDVAIFQAYYCSASDDVGRRRIRV